MKHALKIALSCACLAACAQKPPVQVSIPVAVSCIAHDKVPTLPTPLAEMPDDANAALALALDKLVDWKAYGIEADGALRACSQIR